MTRLVMDDALLRIRICGGMHCAGNGGGRPLLRAFEQALQKENLLDQVELLQAHCLGECADGPCVRIGGDRFYHVTLADVPDLIRQEVLPRIP